MVQSLFVLINGELVDVANARGILREECTLVFEYPGEDEESVIEFESEEAAIRAELKLHTLLESMQMMARI